MVLHSIFRLWALLPVALLLIITGLLAFVTKILLERPGFPPFGIFVFLAFFIFALIWLVFGELRTKVIKVQIEDEKVIVLNYLGLGIPKMYTFLQMDGFETALLPSKYNMYEYLFLIEKGKKVVKLSQFYHSNYADLKNTLTEKVPNLGQKGFSLKQEVKEIFV